jgi:hypothetical protein
MKPLVQNAGDREQVAEAVGKAERQRKLELADVRAVLTTEEGRRVVWRLFEHARLLETIFTRDPVELGYRAGMQDFIKPLFADVDAACPELFDQMRREAKKREDTDA